VVGIKLLHIACPMQRSNFSIDLRSPLIEKRGRGCHILQKKGQYGFSPAAFLVAAVFGRGFTTAESVKKNG